MSDVLTFSGSIDPFVEAIAEAKRKWPDRVHLRVAENVTLCLQAGERRSSEVWGHYLTDDRTEVGCLVCLEWMHA